jgi:hypothetical protein
MSNKYYYCTSLSGETSYNTCINSDLTVSCNCNDADGSGQIGDLNIDSFESIWKDENKGAFTWNDDEEEINRAIEMAKSIGCDKISFCIGYTLDGTKSDLFNKLFFKNKKTIDEGYYKVIYFK